MSNRENCTNSIDAKMIVEEILGDEIKTLGENYVITEYSNIVTETRLGQEKKIRIKVLSADKQRGLIINAEQSNVAYRNLSGSERREKIKEIISTEQTSQDRLAKMFGVSQRTIAEDMKKIKKEETKL